MKMRNLLNLTGFITENSEGINEDTVSDQLDPIIQGAKDSMYRAKIVIAHGDLRTNWINISNKELEVIYQMVTGE